MLKILQVINLSIKKKINSKKQTNKIKSRKQRINKQNKKKVVKQINQVTIKIKFNESKTLLINLYIYISVISVFIK